MTIFALILIILFALILSFFITAGALYIICWAFSLVFSWKMAIGIWILLNLLSGVFKTTITTKK